MYLFVEHDENKHETSDLQPI